MNIISKLKKMLNRQSILEEKFQFAADNLYELLISLSSALKAFTENNDENIEKYTLEALNIEVRIHKLYHTIIELMYTRETMNFSRQDRVSIFNQILEISDLSDFISRRLRAHHPHLDEKLSSILVDGVEKLENVAELLKSLIIGLLNDFGEVERITWDLHHLQRSMWSYEIDFINGLYNSELKAEDIVYLEDLIRNLRQLMILSVRFADISRRMVFKYTY